MTTDMTYTATALLCLLASPLSLDAALDRFRSCCPDAMDPMLLKRLRSLLKAEAALDHVLEAINDRFGAEPEPCENRGAFIVAHLAPGLADAPSAALLDQVWQEATGCDSPKAAAAVMREAEVALPAAARKADPGRLLALLASPEALDAAIQRPRRGEAPLLRKLRSMVASERARLDDISTIQRICNEICEMVTSHGGGECDPDQTDLAEAWAQLRDMLDPTPEPVEPIPFVGREPLAAAIEMVDELDGVAHERLLTYLKGRYA
jgi:hypothetical protein